MKGVSDLKLAAVFAAVAIVLMALASCSSSDLAAVRAIEVQALDDGLAACRVRDRVIPFVRAGSAIAAAVVPGAAEWVVLDQTTVSPVLDRACAALGGLVVAAPKG